MLEFVWHIETHRRVKSDKLIVGKYFFIVLQHRLMAGQCTTGNPRMEFGTIGLIYSNSLQPSCSTRSLRPCIRSINLPIQILDTG